MRDQSRDWKPAKAPESIKSREYWEPLCLSVPARNPNHTEPRVRCDREIPINQLDSRTPER